jgi:hypothetical protein
VGYYINNPEGERLVYEYFSALDDAEICIVKKSYMDMNNKVHDIIRPHQYKAETENITNAICQEISKLINNDTLEYKINQTDTLTGSPHLSKFEFLDGFGISHELVSFAIYSSIFWKKIK